MTKALTEEMIEFAAGKYSAGWSMQEIADAVTDKWNLPAPVHKQRIQAAATADRERFPRRSQAEKNRLIADGMKFAMEDRGYVPFGKKREDAFEW